MLELSKAIKKAASSWTVSAGDGCRGAMGRSIFGGFRRMFGRPALWCAALSLAFAASCKKGDADVQPPVAPGSGFSVATEAHTGASKTHLGDDNLQVVWDDDNERIMVFEGVSSTPKSGTAFFMSERKDDTHALFTEEGNFDYSAASYYAIYPVFNGATCVKNESESTVTTSEVTLWPNGVQEMSEDGFAKNANPMAAYSTTTSLQFKNLCGILRVSLTGSESIGAIRVTSDKPADVLWGTGSVTFTSGTNNPALGTLTGGDNSLTLRCDSDGGGVELTSTPKVFNIVLPPNTLGRGFYVEVIDKDGFRMMRKHTSSTESVEAGKIIVMNKLGVARVPAPSGITDLSYYKYGVLQSARNTANCYIVRGTTGGDYCFPCTIKGNGVPSRNASLIEANIEGARGKSCANVGAVHDAVLLWETQNVAAAPTSDFITGVELISGGTYVKFHHTGTAGNAVIAVRDNAGNILWSWHIWCTGGFNLEDSPHQYRNLPADMKVMQCNLGALSAYSGSGTGGSSLGLLYQWGRKDPFTGGYNMTIDGTTTLAGAKFNSGVVAASDFGTTSTLGFEQSVKEPYNFITTLGAPNDWFSSKGGASNGLWGSASDNTCNTKTMYDPCPPGWMVPGKAGSTYNTIWNAATEKDSGNITWPSGTSWTNHIQRANNTDYSLKLSYKDGDGSFVAYYPASGTRFSSSGGLVNVGSNGCYWSAAPNGNNAYYLSFYSSNVSPSYNNSRALGFPVRPVQESSSSSK